MQRTIKLYKLPAEPTITGLRPLNYFLFLWISYPLVPCVALWHVTNAASWWPLPIEIAPSLARVAHVSIGLLIATALDSIDVISRC